MRLGPPEYTSAGPVPILARMPQDTIAALVADAATSSPDAIAILAPDRPPLTYAGLARAVEGVAAALRSAGIKRTDRVALVTANGPAAASAFLGIASAAIAAPLNPTYRSDEIEFFLTDLRAKVVLVQAGLDTPAAEVAARLGIPVLTIRTSTDGPAGAFDLGRTGEGSASTAVAAPNGVPTTPTPTDVALILHTSGTTARPKIVPLTHGRLVASARTIAATLQLSPADRCLNVMPLFHIHGLVAAVMATLASGGSMVAAPGFLAPSFFGWLDAFEPTWYTAVPTIHQAVLARAGANGDVIARRPLRFIRSSSASLPTATLEGLERAFRTPVVEAYGMTEAAHQMASNPVPPGIRKPGSVGRATGLDITILDPDGTPQPAGTVGEVAIRGATVFDGYDANPDANASAFVDGWFRTGDQGTLDDDGYLHLRGRLKELINRGGEKVAPVEVEEALLAIPGVAQAVVFAMPDARLGEEVAAAVVARDGVTLTERELQSQLAEHLADFKVPRVIRILAEIPKGATGKVQRIGLAGKLGLVGMPPPGEPRTTSERHAVSALRTPTEVAVAAIWAEVLGLPAVGVRDDFFAIGGDSMLAAIIVTRLIERLGQRELPLATFLWAPTVERYARGLDTGSWGVPTSALLPIQPDGGRPPFFFVHIDDEIIGPAALRRTLDPDQPLYGLRAMGMDGGNLPPSIDGLADAFLAEIRTIQPDGPYFIGGYCSGGRVAIEMARRLQAAGQGVGFLGLVDPRIDRRHPWRWYIGRPAYYRRRFALHLRRGRLRHATTGLARQLVRRVTKPHGDRPLDRDGYLDALAETRRAQVLVPYPGDLVVFSSRDYDVPRAFWDGLAEHVDWQPLPVDHETIFQGEDGAVFAARLSAKLQATGTGS